MRPLFRKTFFLIFVIFLIMAFGKFWWAKTQKSPFAHIPKDVQVTLKEGASENDKRVAYRIMSQDIQGEATLTESSLLSSGSSMVDSLMVGAKGIFETSRAAYAGHITAMIECKTKIYLKEEVVHFEGKDTKLLLAVSGNPRSFGTCAMDQMSYASAFWAAYDERTKQVITIKLFKPITGLHQIEESQQQIAQVFKKIIN